MLTAKSWWTIPEKIHEDMEFPGLLKKKEYVEIPWVS